MIQNALVLSITIKKKLSQILTNLNIHLKGILSKNKAATQVYFVFSGRF